MDNYPDDMEATSDDPRSPLYDCKCKICGDDQGCDCDELENPYEDDPFWKEED